MTYKVSHTVATALAADHEAALAAWRANGDTLAEPAGQSASFQFATRTAGTGNVPPGTPVCSPAPGSAAVSQLELLAVLGQERFTPSGTDPRSEARTDRHLPS